MSYFEKSKGAILSFSRAVLMPSMVVMAIALLGIQLTEYSGNKEILPLSSFVLLLSLSALGFNWCRTAPRYSSEAALETACRSAITLFVASLLALVSAGLAFVQQSNTWMPDRLATPIFVLHWLFLALALALFLAAILSMLSHARLKQ
ncbi:MAG: hypothetical protein LJE70_14460 [Chromatiaceae bacterium]|nr:hypothetical protein [Chromatiaceae bacterium]